MWRRVTRRCKVTWVLQLQGWRNHKQYVACFGALLWPRIPEKQLLDRIWNTWYVLSVCCWRRSFVSPKGCRRFYQGARQKIVERNLFTLKHWGEGLLTLWVTGWGEWGSVKPSYSPIRATRGKKGAFTRVSQKSLKSSVVDGDQVTEPFYCRIAFRNYKESYGIYEYKC